MRFEVLGPLRVHTSTGEVTISSGRERTLLAVLLLHANRTVPNDQLIEAIWAEQPPPGARNQLQGCVSRLRKRLATTGLVIITEPAGYRANLPPTDLDLLEFRRLVSQARTATAAGDHPASVTSYRAALDLWRGPALGGIDTGPAHAAAALDEEHVQVQEEYIEAELTAGGAGRLVPELTELVGQHPHRERLHRALMLALYRAGRQADALAAYRHARTMLNDELGIEPGPELQRLHQAILNRDPDLDAPPIPAHASAASSAQPPVPRELPADVAGFTGRAEALQALDELLDREPPHGPPTPVVISAIAGMAGVGKTALAVHWAHRVTDRFPHGQLYLNLRGYATTAPVRPIEALSALLRSLGAPPEQIPTDETQAAALYRTKLADRQALIVLDNARSVDQVRPLLPGSSCTVLITSRDSLAGLVVVDGARRVDLGPLSPTESVTLLRRLIGARAVSDADATTKLAHQCAQLPLALRIAAELATSRSAAPLAELVVELNDQQRRLALLEAGDDPHAAVRVVFSWSFQHLPKEASRTFRLLGLHPGPHADPYAVSALADTSIESARRALELLTRAHLVHASTEGRYGMHDLLRAYSNHLAATECTNHQRQAALGRLLAYYVGVAAAAMDIWYPAEAHRRPEVSVPATPVPDLADPDAALGWLDTERPCLVAAVQTAAAGWPAEASQLSSILGRYLDSGHYYDALAVHDYAYHAARQAGDVGGQAHALRHSGAAYTKIGDYERAAHALQQAIALFRRIGDCLGEALAANTLGVVEERLGQYDVATDHHWTALRLFRKAGDQTGVAIALDRLGVLGGRLGRYEPAADHFRQALAAFRKIGNEVGQAHALNNLGVVEQRLGRSEPAADYHRQALTLFRKLGERQGVATALDSLGADHIHLGQPERAAEYYTQALVLFREIGDQDGEAQALNGLGEALLNRGRPSDALTHHTDALNVASITGTRDDQARAHTGLGHAQRALGDLALAREHYQHALAHYTDLGAPEANEVRSFLDSLAPAAGIQDSGLRAQRDSA